MRQSDLLLRQAIKLVYGPPRSGQPPPSLLRLGVLEPCFPALFSIAYLQVCSLLLPEATSTAIEPGPSPEVPPAQKEVRVRHVLGGLACSKISGGTVWLPHVVLANHLAHSELVEGRRLQRRDVGFGAIGVEARCADLR